VRGSTWLVRALVTGTVIACGLGAWRSAAAPAGAQASGAPTPPQSLGRELYQHDCAVCHGPAGEGSQRAPMIATDGLADLDFMISTGRMPIDGTEAPTERRAPRYTPAQIDAILAYAATFVTGEAIPSADVAGADLARGGEVYRLNCAACHHATGSGGVLAYGVEVPPVDQATPVQVVEALRVGPAQMPAFNRDTISDGDAAAVAAYVRELSDPDDRGGVDLGHFGPVPEGAIALLVGLGGLVLVTRLLGTRERPPAHAVVVTSPTSPTVGGAAATPEGVSGWVRGRAERDAPMQAASARQPLDPGAPPPSPEADVLDVLTRDHDHVDALLKELAASPGDPEPAAPGARRRRGERARLIAVAVGRHEAAEQAHLWPAVRAGLPDGPAVAERAEAQEREGREILADLLAAEPGTPRFDELVTRLESAQHRHVAFEDTVFLRLRGALPEDARVALGRLVQEAQARDAGGSPPAGSSPD
jgi:ubiquinol-cytochrome c reductase cytochrome c subunit